MANKKSLVPFKKGEDERRNLTGRPNALNRSTIARRVLEMKALLPQNTLDALQQIYPDIQQRMTAEEVATIVLIGNVIAKGDVNAYKAIMDSAYGSPKQEIDTTVRTEQPLFGDVE